MKTYFSLKRLKQHFWFGIANLPMPGHGYRPFFVKMGGVNILEVKKTFIGKNVTFDGVHPELITIEPGVRVADGCSILTHYINPTTCCYINGEVKIKKGSFIGTKTIITKSVVIGEKAIVGAGSVITKDIPDYEVWAGNPAHFIRKIK